MSSAAKLRKYGRGTATVAAAALVMTSFGPAAFAWPDTAAVPSATGGASIGVVDNNLDGTFDNGATTNNQGATLLQAGQNNQPMGDMRLVLPNTFANGDLIDLYVFDREATGDANTPATDGSLNIDAAHAFSFANAGSVSVNGTPYAAATQVNPDTDAATDNTELPAGLTPYTVTGTDPTPVAPRLAVSAIEGPNALTGQPNVIRLRVNGTSSVGSADAKWVVDLSDILVNLGPSVSPGELRVVPFARTATTTPGVYSQSPMFSGNVLDSDLGATGNQYLIDTYTVPSFVSPVTIAQESPSGIVADGSTQGVGPVTISETQVYSLEAGTYTLTVNGADIVNPNGTSAPSVGVTLIDPATGETVTTVGTVNQANHTVSFDLTQADPTAALAKKSSIRISGLQLSANTAGPISYTLSGGSIDGTNGFLTTAGGTADPWGAASVGAADAFGTGAVNQIDILAPTDELVQTGTATSASNRIGGNNRYETAAKIAERWASGNKSFGGAGHGKLKNVILASGENFPDALSAAYLSQRMNAPILLTYRNALPGDTVEALRDRQVEKVFIIGGEAAVGSDVASQLTALKSYYYDSTDETVKAGADNLQVVRLGGSTRYTTNQYVNMYAAAWGSSDATIGKMVYRFGEPQKNTAIFARGDNFPDALAAGVLTRGVSPAGETPQEISDRAFPLVLTAPGELSASARDQVERLDIANALIIGSEDALSNDVKTSLEDLGLSNTRIGGKDRYFTAAAVDEFAMRPATASSTNEYPGLGFLEAQGSGYDDNTTLVSYLATGLKFPDALTASPWIGRNRDALNLVWPTDLTDGTRDFLSKRAADISRVVALGLGDAVSTRVLSEANTIASTK